MPKPKETTNELAEVAKHACECEHIAHQPREKGQLRSTTPNGNPGHKYGVQYFNHAIVQVQTTWGKFWVCRDCAADCYKQYPEVGND